MNLNKNELGKIHWYELASDEVIATLGTNSKQGLSKEEVAHRMESFGENILPLKKKKNSFLRFLAHFNDILIYVLLAAAVVTFLLGHTLDTLVILLVSIINAFIGFVQEGKAERELDTIREMLSPKATVLREGQRTEIDASLLTIGDLVFLKPGVKIPADLRLLEAHNLRIEEAALTGESIPSEKNTIVLPTGTMLGDRSNMAFSSTTVSAGTGVGVVVGIGEQTEIGKINDLIQHTNALETPLLKQTAQFGKTLSYTLLLLGLLIFLFGYFFRSYPTKELFLAVIGLTIAAIPEGLPAILSVILAIGVQNMAKRNAIVKNLPSVETLGAVSVICSDKTGTLTKNEMTVTRVISCKEDYEVTGLGYIPEGSIKKQNLSINIAEEVDLNLLLSCVKICNEAHLHKNTKGQWLVTGEPTEAALLVLFHKAKQKEPEADRIATIPFDSEYKYMATLVKGDTENRIYLKGAPDKLLQMASYQQCGEEIQTLNVDLWQKRSTQLAQQGLRLIGAAYKIVDKDLEQIEHTDLDEGIIFLGITGIIDPPREEAIEAIRVCRQAGIEVKMITGDHIDTAKTIGKQMGIDDGEYALQGKDLEEMTENEMIKAVSHCNIFARTSPEHKLRLVKAIQSDGSICAMTGDGVNDAPALKSADMGIAMGIKGTEVSKEAANMVLVDDNFSSIVKAVEEGRRVYDNLKKTILFILPTNGAESLLITAAILFGVAMPLTAIQILWVNMITAVTISLALAFEKIEPDAMQRHPRSPKTPLLEGYFIWRILFVSVLIGGGALYINLHLLKEGFENASVRSITLQCLAFSQLFHLYNIRSKWNFAFNKDFFSNKSVFLVSAILIIMQLGAVYLPFMNQVLGTSALSLSDWKYPLLLGLAVFTVVEIEKWIVRKFYIVKPKPI